MQYLPVSDGTARLRITLVHGTYGRNAAWVAPGSSIRSSIEESCWNCVFEEPLYWSGKNLMSHRLKAADELARRLLACAARFPQDLHVLLGHSHGGSVIAYCLERHANVLPHVAGAAFLATPFVDFRPRPGWEREARTLCIGAAFVTWLGLAIGAPLMIAELGFGTQISEMGMWMILAGILVSAFAFALIAEQIADRAITRLRQRIDRLATGFATAHLPEGPCYLFIRSPGDEAAGILSSFQTLAWLGARSMAVVSWLYALAVAFLRKRWEARGRPRLLLVIGACLLALGTFAFVVSMHIFNTPSVRTFFFAPFDNWDMSLDAVPAPIVWSIEASVRIFMLAALAAALTTLLLFGLLVLACVLLALSLLAFGTSLWYVGPFVELVVEPVPRGTWPLHRLDWGEVDNDSIPIGLTHSEPYQTRQAQETICNWLHELHKRP